ncbi:hypothetical protein JP75_06000 [Devosia riboflavina]|uniref:Plasmid stabilization protein n=1 Tax=Devosia riboflavina TaxID=46914 RepID=A0A087M4Z4_9HYPH|nr:type II toxin-antitoxin system RelE/ParE family toxin [Devosia riboflavina]KFL31947.1 hypothetical protein JP75_06000 [Devosia riboflavina]
MREARLSPAARRQIADIWYFIAEESERSADKVINGILDAIDLAAENPNMGSPRDDIQDRLRMLVVGSYLAFYRPEVEMIWVAAVVHAMREPKSWLD